MLTDSYFILFGNTLWVILNVLFLISLVCRQKVGFGVFLGGLGGWLGYFLVYFKKKLMFYEHIGQTCRLDGKWSLNWVTSQQFAGLEEVHTLRMSSFGLFCSALQTFSPWAWQNYGCNRNPIHFQTLKGTLLTWCPFNSTIPLKTVMKQPCIAALFCFRTENNLNNLSWARCRNVCVSSAHRWKLWGVPTLPQHSELCCCHSTAGTSSQSWSSVLAPIWDALLHVALARAHRSGQDTHKEALSEAAAGLLC